MTAAHGKRRGLRLRAGLPVLAIGAALIVAAPAVAEHDRSLLPPDKDSVILPFDVQDGFILLSGKAVGVCGVFMFDTGTPFEFLMNNTVVPVVLSGEPFPGKAGSGQSFDIHLHDSVGPVAVAGYSIVPAGPVPSGNLRWLTEEFRQDFLGFAGHTLIRDKVMMIDYQAGQITLAHPGAGDLPQTGSIPGAITLTFDAFDGGRPNLPVVHADLAGVPIEVMFDTGTAGVLELTPDARSTLVAAGALKIADNGAALPELAVQGKTVDAWAAELKEGGSNRLTAGYATLSRYISIWDFPGGRITLIPLPSDAGGASSPHRRIVKQGGVPPCP
jgi:hypothetical protein